ncbi:MAG TPA: alpha-amylase family glycosyl hydrolase [Ideonella sp.]|uniref:alpha-amylase family glycosyl hydrolase n=1 Tax=Ideonella sp. TaxID=1929293 RepID=UPI002E304BB8|nr:alpha-amylase family glycosyl hydrolase [Ideonella sp.]HEX5682393.1 alpha-amylase family glycosyl hydrolase [Ideonella sp.]
MTGGARHQLAHVIGAALGLFAAQAGAAAAPHCSTDPLAGRALYLRGSFNAWAADEAHRLRWACDRYVLVTRLGGDQRFKIGDEPWSPDADFGQGLGAQLRRQGPDISRRFNGTHRITLTMSTDTLATPTLSVEDCPSAAPPFGDTVLYLRGSMNNWAALDEYALQYSCDAYYLNTKLKGKHEFKLADAAWTPSLTSEGHTLEFDGEQTLRAVIVAERPLVSLGPKTFADPNSQPVEHPVAQSLRFDSRSLQHKAPFGAVVEHTPIEFAVSALPGVTKLTLVVEQRRLEGNQEVLAYLPVARVPMTRLAFDKLRQNGVGMGVVSSPVPAEPPSVRAEPVEAPARDTWTARHTFTTKAIYGYWFEAEIDGQTFVLQNNAESVFWTREKGSHGVGAVAPLPTRQSAIRRFRQTVYDANFKVPDYAPDLVYYYIFPDRFRNGDKRNDPVGGRDRYQDQTVELHRNWNEKPWKPGTGDGSDAVYNNDFFGGDLAGIIDKLDYIQDLGANAIYMTPIFKAASNHKYDTADYHQVDPAFGNNADFERLCREAAKRGIRVIPDASLNHVGSDSVYFNRYGNHGDNGAFQNGRINAASPYASWFTLDPTQPDADKQFKGWVGVRDLPELNKASPAWRAFAYGNPDSVMKVWLDRGASGWRMDVAPWVPDDFWREWRSAIKTHQPDAITIAETWFDSSKYFLGDAFDSTMNYIFRNTLLEYAAGGDATVLYRNLESIREAYPPQAFHALMNLLSTHDQARSLHVLGWTDGASAEAVALAKRRYRLALLFQMTFPGSPAVYYGDEVGVTGGDDPYNRATYPWADEGGKPDDAMLAEFKRLIALRHRHAVLRRGSLEAPLFTDAHAIVLARRLGDQWAITATNNADAPRTATVKLPAGAPKRWSDALNASHPAAIAENGQLTLQLPALGGTVLISSPE